nr:reverse transcriptase domain-containing protein [Tanacetum cinerariifolium]
MENANNINRNPELREAHVTRKCSYKEFMSCQPFNFKGSEGVVSLIRWFKRTELVFSCSNCNEDCKVKFATALEAQAANMENANNINRNPELREAHVTRKCSYKEFMSCQPFNFKGSEGVVSLIRWFKRTELVFSFSNCNEDCKVKFATGTLTEEALYWWNSFAQPIGIKEDYKLSWVEFKKLLIKKSYAAIPAENSGYTGYRPLCKKCTLHHTGPCIVKCNTCNKVGHLTKNCRNKGPATGSNLLRVTVTCHACGEKVHYANQCQKTTNNNAQGKAYMLRDKNAHPDLNVVTDIPIVREFPDVVPEYLPGLPPVRQVEF